MRTKLLAAATAIAALGGVSLEAFAQAKPDQLVKQRQAAMTLQAKYLGPIGAMMKAWQGLSATVKGSLSTDVVLMPSVATTARRHLSPPGN